MEVLAAKAQSHYEQAVARQQASYLQALAEHNKHKATFEAAFMAEQEKLREVRESIHRPLGCGLVARINLALRVLPLPSFVSREGQPKFESDSGILIHEHRFPDLAAIRWVKQVYILLSHASSLSSSLSQRNERAAPRSFSSTAGGGWYALCATS
jgi:hypothetical protein